MEQLKVIIEEGKNINIKSIHPTIDDKLSSKIALLRLLDDKDIFVMNKKLFDWKKRIEKKEIVLSQSPEDTEKIADWLLDPLLIFCSDLEETSKRICNKLFEQGFKYIRARNDIYPSRIIIDIEFEIAAILCNNNKSISKHSNDLVLYGANINVNGELMLPILLYEYITPKFNYVDWKSNLELEPFLWEGMKQKWVKKGVNHPIYSNIDVSKDIFNLIKSEDEGAYLFTGYYTYFLMTNQKGEYNGDYHIYHREPMEFLKKIYEAYPDMKVREENPIYYFQNKSYYLLHNNEHVLTVSQLEYPMNFTRLGFYNHTNYHGLLLFLLIEAFKFSLKDYDDKISHIGYLIKAKNNYKGGHNFNILQNNIIGPRTSPALEFKIKEWNKDLTFFYRPDVSSEVVEEENDSV